MALENKQTKITMTVWKDLFDLFSKKLDGCFIKRDAFLNHVISVELDTLKRGVAGRKNSATSKKYISSNLKSLGTKSINVVVDKQVAIDLNNIVKEHNLVRDAFINRLLLLLCFPENTIAYLFDVKLTFVVDSVIEVNPGYVDMLPPPRTFIDALEYIQSSPNFYVQEELTHRYGTDSADLESNIYTKRLDVGTTIKVSTNETQRDFFQKLNSHAAAFSCYLGDQEKKVFEALKELSALELDLPKKGQE